jgi:hypothetical protein
MRLVNQKSKNDCGICIIAMIYSHFFDDESDVYTSIAEEINISDKGLSLIEIERFCFKHKIKIDFFDYPGQDKVVSIAKDSKPFILYKNNHYMVCVKKCDQFEIYDPGLEQTIKTKNLDGFGFSIIGFCKKSYVINVPIPAFNKKIFSLQILDLVSWTFLVALSFILRFIEYRMIVILISNFSISKDMIRTLLSLIIVIICIVAVRVTDSIIEQLQTRNVNKNIIKLSELFFSSSGKNGKKFKLINTKEKWLENYFLIQKVSFQYVNRIISIIQFFCSMILINMILYRFNVYSILIVNLLNITASFVYCNETSETNSTNTISNICDSLYSNNKQLYYELWQKMLVSRKFNEAIKSNNTDFIFQILNGIVPAISIVTIALLNQDINNALVNFIVIYYFIFQHRNVTGVFVKTWFRSSFSKNCRSVFDFIAFSDSDHYEELPTHYCLNDKIIEIKKTVFIEDIYDTKFLQLDELTGVLCDVTSKIAIVKYSSNLKGVSNQLEFIPKNKQYAIDFSYCSEEEFATEYYKIWNRNNWILIVNKQQMRWVKNSKNQDTNIDS